MDSQHTTVRPEHADRESIAILALLALSGLVPVGVALARGLRFGPGETIGLILITFAVWGSLRERIGRRHPTDPAALEARCAASRRAHVGVEGRARP